MKKVVFLALLSLMALGATAQSLNLGIHGGLTQAKVDIDELKVTQRTGYMFGAFLRINPGKLYIEPSLDFVHKESDVKNSGVTSALKYSSVNVPVMVGYHLLRLPVFKLRGYVGPEASFVTSKLKIKDMPSQLK